MNSLAIIAFMDDWQISARLATFSNTFSYELFFYDNRFKICEINAKKILIIDTDHLDKQHFINLNLSLEKDIIFILGYSTNLNKKRINELKILGYDMIMNRKNLFNNLNNIIRQVINAS